KQSVTDACARWNLRNDSRRLRNRKIEGNGNLRSPGQQRNAALYGSRRFLQRDVHRTGESGLSLKSKGLKELPESFLWVQYTVANTSAHSDRSGPTMHRFRLRDCKRWQSHAAAATGLPRHCAGRCGNGQRLVAHALAHSPVRQSLQAELTLPRQSVRSRIRRLPARRSTRMARAHPSSASVRAWTLSVLPLRSALRKTVRNRWAKRLLDFPHKQDIQDRVAG